MKKYFRKENHDNPVELVNSVAEEIKGNKAVTTSVISLDNTTEIQRECEPLLYFQ